MPPVGLPRPDPSRYESIATTIEAALDRAYERSPNPGFVPVRRLTRTEYTNAVRDLLGLSLKGQSLLPPDDSLDGFDNSAGMLTVSPALLERYLAAARKVSRFALGDPTLTAASDTYDVPKLMYQDDRMSEDLPFGSRGGLAFSHLFLLDAEYVVKIRLARSLYEYVRGLKDPHTLEVRLDGRLIRAFTVGGKDIGRPAPLTYNNNLLGSPDWEINMLTADAGLEFRFQVSAGAHVVGVSFLEEPLEEEGVLQPPAKGFAFSQTEMWDGLPSIRSVVVSGPYGTVGSGDSASRRKILVCKSAAHEERCARQIFSGLAKRAYRRPIIDADVESLMADFRTGRADGGFEAGIRNGLERLLIDPEFLFRFERDPAGAEPGAVHRLSDLELAARLSFFLWRSIPDDVLLDLGSRGQLSRDGELRRQVRRMLSDSRARTMIQDFARQWLQLRSVATATPHVEVYPDFDENLREALAAETRLFIVDSFRADLPVTSLLDADYTFVNERLAKHYGIRGVSGSHFRRVSLTDPRRRGLLGHGSILMATSYPDRTSPVVRGRWVLENFLGMPPPPPPPDVPPLRPTDEQGRPASVRERLEQHRRNAACATCHNKMDPWGLALEHFDAVGQWREKSELGTPIDAIVTLPDGRRIDGAEGTLAPLAEHRDLFVETVIEKLLTYALGRPAEYSDRPAVRKIARQAAATGFRWSSVIEGIIRSTPFQMRRVPQ